MVAHNAEVAVLFLVQLDAHIGQALASQAAYGRTCLADVAGEGEHADPAHGRDVGTYILADLIAEGLVRKQGAVVAIGRCGLDLVNVAGNSGNALEAAFGIDQGTEFVGPELVLLHQVNHDRRVETAGAAGHDQAVGRRHAHRGVDRTAVIDGADRGAEAKVTGNDLQFTQRTLDHFGRL